MGRCSVTDDKSVAGDEVVELNGIAVVGSIETDLEITRDRQADGTWRQRRKPPPTR